ncbi:2-amino-4-hydroxy-6-hydroxymethyldihydropteridine diphosphokinase [Algisphaera agarilytica]|uniref:2-amino-4-hydroxy-6-hydroxymethyldihydropteridine pyrophosphokinase n=1 Tax=Algisphaera agarilytica TaxID=1385975 RepID=A0A7X0H3C1_9BACT|nr:2-amino-4-hydroxy-6-hydroxymethyldihydropteridine diphosphokinase [Algisphaera agarilytica]MBB6428517.1 2-amino-4-hydroxy-6-hydroxymethyldihydropteridine diphosphokinase [Algisphaera agarilytica]
MPPYSPEPENPADGSGPATAYIALGSNLGDRRAHLDAALAAIGELPGVGEVTPSTYYETAPVGPQDQGMFLNAAARVATASTPEAFLEQLLTLERRLGRPPREERRHWGPREIDLDLLLHGNTVLDLPGLTLPHPRLHERAFVLRPLCDIAAEVPHPLFRQTMRELLAEVERDAEAQAEVSP